MILGPANPTFVRLRAAPLFASTLLVVVLALAASGCAKRRYKMPSSSMVPVHPAGQSITCNTSEKTPKRGDVFVFDYPENPKQAYIKRVVALPGDKVGTASGRLVLNGAPVPRCVVGVWSYSDDTGSLHEGTLELEKLDSSSYLTFYDKAAFDHGDQGPWQVKPGEFWVMGDNRENSHDSRMWNAGQGAGVPQALLTGRVPSEAAALPKGAEGLSGTFAECKKTLGVP